MPNVTRRDFAAGLMGGLGAAPRLGAQPRRRPNIVFICSDQHSGRVLGCGGHPIVHTPNMDRLARAGVLFRNTYTGSPVCVPGRASMMSGRFASDVNSYCNSTPMGREASWGNYLREAGYKCRAYGKLDLTKGVDYGFEEIHTGHDHSSNPDITSLFRAPVCIRPDARENANGEFRERQHADGARTKDALDFLRAPKPGEPWALYLGLTQPHPTFIAQPKYLQIYPPDQMPLPQIAPGYLEKRPVPFQVLADFQCVQLPVPAVRVRRARAAYFGMISELDEHVGHVLDELERTGEMDNTLVVYTSDHGEMLGEHGLWLKNVLLENAARVPLILAGGGLPRGKVIDTPVSHIDMVATMLDIADAPRPATLRGTSLVDLAHGRTGAGPHYVYAESHSEGNCTGSFITRKENWKYFYFTGDDPLLFDLQKDPGEMNNLAGRPETAAIEKELHDHLVSLVDPDAITNRAFDAQARVLEGMVQRMKREEFYQTLVGRLGKAQARIQTERHYARRA